MTVQLQSGVLPQGMSVAIRIEMTAQVNITPYVARQKVTRFVITEISTQLLGEPPELRIGERLCWCVPVVLTSPREGSWARWAKSRWMPRRASCSSMRTPCRG